jgi:hypothetical protein
MIKKARWIFLLVGVATLVLAGVASAASSNAPMNYSGSPRGGYYCSGSNTRNHPVGEQLAADYGVTYQEIMDRFCLEGYGFGEIKLAYYIAGQAGVDVSEVFDMRAAGSGWGKIFQNYGLHGKSGKTTVTTTSAPVTTTSTTSASVSTTPVPPQVNGPGNSNGHGHGGGNGNGNGNGNGKALGRTR